MKNLTTLVILSFACLLVACNDKVVEDNIAMYTHVWDEILNKGDIDVIDTHFSPDYVFNTVSVEVKGQADAKTYYGAYLTGFSDIEFKVLEIYGQGDHLVKRWAFKGTHTGELSGIPPSGNKVSVEGVTIAKIVNGKIVQERDYMDDLGFFQQLGVIPPLE